VCVCVCVTICMSSCVSMCADIHEAMPVLVCMRVSRQP
jgi:hypothetical protein